MFQKKKKPNAVEPRFFHRDSPERKPVKRLPSAPLGGRDHAALMATRSAPLPKSITAIGKRPGAFESTAQGVESSPPLTKAAKELAQYPSHEVLLPIGGEIEFVTSYDIGNGIMAVPFYNIVDHSVNQNLGYSLEPVSNERMVEFIKDILANVEMLKMVPSGSALIDFFSQICTSIPPQSGDTRIEAADGRKVNSMLFLSPTHPGHAVVSGRNVRLGKSRHSALYSNASSNLTGSPSIVQFDPRIALAVDVDGDLYYSWPWEGFAHELAHAGHSASGTRTDRGVKYSLRIPEGPSEESCEYLTEGEELFTHSRPEARAYAGDQDGVDDSVSLRVNGTSIEVRLSKAEAELQSCFLERINMKSDENLRIALAVRRSIFGIGEWQITSEFGHSARPMYNAPKGATWKYTEHQILSQVQIVELMQLYPTLYHAIQAGATRVACDMHAN